MYAVVAPLRRLPASMSGFDYAIPEGLSVQVGDLVEVPFRARTLLGVVLALHQESRLATATMLGVRRAGWLAADDLARLHELAELSGENVSSFCTLLDEGEAAEAVVRVRPAAPLSLRAEEVTELTAVEAVLRALPAAGYAQFCATDEVAIAALQRLQQREARQVLVLAPEARTADQLAAFLGAPALTGTTPPRERARLHAAWQRGNLHTLVATSKGSILPAANLGTVAIFHAGHDEHIARRRAPKFDALQAALLLANQHRAHLITFDQLFPLRLPEAPQEIIVAPPATPTVIEPWRPEHRGPHLILSAPVLAAAEHTLRKGQSVVFFLNRKGVAQRLHCGACGHIPTCGTCGQVPGVREHDLRCHHCGSEMWIPKTCPQCGAKKITFKSVGLTKVAQLAKKHLAGWPAIVLEKGKTPIIPDKPHLLITTDRFWSSRAAPFTAPRYGLVAELAADLSLYAGDSGALESTARRLRRAAAFARRQRAQLIYQVSDRSLFDPTDSLTTVIATERALRKKYSLPPYGQPHRTSLP